jgi:hypothetical protein
MQERRLIGNYDAGHTLVRAIRANIGSMQVLVIEDDLVIQKFLKRSLSDAGVRD